MKVFELFGELDLKTDKFDSAIDRKKGILGSLTGVAKKAALGVGAALIGAGVAGTIQFASFDKGMREVFTLMPGISQKAMGEMSDQVKDFSAEFGVLPTKTIPALYQSLSAGVPPNNVFKFLEVAQKAAKGGVTELETAVDGISSTINAYGKDTLSATKASDLMFTAVRMGKTTFDELSASLFNVNPIAASVGVKFGDVTASLAAMTSQGVPTSVATTQLRQMLVELSKSGTVTSEVFKKISGKSFKEFVASGGDVQGALQMLEAHAGKSGKGINDLFGSVEAGSAALALTGKGTEKFSESLAAMKHSAGATDGAFKTMSGGLSDAFDKIKAAGSVLLIEFGELLAPAIMAVANVILEWVPKIGDVIDQVFGTIGPIIEGFVGGLGGAGGEVGAFAALIALHWGNIRDLARDLWPKIQKIVESAIEMVRAIIERVTTTIQIIWNRWGDNILRAVQTTWNLIRTVVESALKIIQGIIDVVTGIMKGDWSRVWDGIKKILAGVWDVMVGIVKAAVGLVHNLITAAWDGIRAITNTVWDRIKELVAGAWKEILTAVRNAVGNLIVFMANLPGRIVKAIGDLGKLLIDAGRNLITGLIDGIKAGLDELMSTVSGVAGKIRDFFPFSPAKTGPLSGSGSLKNAGKNLMKDLVEGMKAEQGRVESHLAKITGKLKDFTGTIKGAFDFSLQGAIGDGESPIEALSDRIHLQLQESRDFAKTLRQLSQAGASKALLTDIASAGRTEGMEIGRALLADMRSPNSQNLLGFANDAFKEISQIAGNVSGDLGQRFFGDRIDEARDELQALTGDIRELRRAFKENPDDFEEFVKAFKVAVRQGG